MPVKRRRSKYRPKWKDDPKREWARRVKKRDYRCRACGRIGWLQAHHIIPASIMPDLVLELFNGISLCMYHHVEIHRQKLDIELLPEMYAHLEAGREDLNVILENHPAFEAVIMMPWKRLPKHELLRVIPKDYVKELRLRWPEFAAAYLT